MLIRFNPIYMLNFTIIITKTKGLLTIRIVELSTDPSISSLNSYLHY